MAFELYRVSHVKEGATQTKSKTSSSLFGVTSDTFC